MESFCTESVWNAARAYSSAFFSFFNRAYARDRMICALICKTKCHKPDGFVVDPTTKLYSKYAYDPYVRDDCWMTDDDGDGTWELYVFDENGYLCADVDINGMGYTTWGLHNVYGRLSTQYYKGVWDDVGPIQVVNHDNAWYCENGTLPSFASNAAWSFTGDYARDAGEIYAGLKLQISRMSSGSYRNVETITIK